MITCNHGKEKKPSNIFTMEEIQIHEVNFTNAVDDAVIIDSGCARSCSGKSWTETFLRTLSEYDCLKVSRQDSKARFRFGSGKSVTSMYYVIAPVYIGGMRKYLGWDVVDLDLPLLLSLPVLKKMDVVVQ